MSVLRIDTGTVSGVERTPQGGLRVDARVAKVGVQSYTDTNGRTWSEFRPPEEVFAPESLATLPNAPVTDTHPPTLVTSENWKTYSKGHVDGAPRQDANEFVGAHLVVQDADVVALIEGRLRHDVSAGYTCDLDPTSGVYNGQRYDAVQRNIKFNHVALLPEGKGRAGADVALRMDGAAVQVSAADPSARGETMKIKILGREYRCDDAGDMKTLGDDVDKYAAEKKAKMDADSAANVEAMTALRKSLSDALVMVATLEAKLTTAVQASEAEESTDPMPEDELDTVAPEEVLDSRKARRLVTKALIGKVALKGMRADALRMLVSTKLGAIADTRATELTKLRADAKAILGDAFDVKDKTPAQIRAAVIGKLAPSIKLDSVDAKGVLQMYEAVTLTVATVKPAARNDATAALHVEIVEGARNDAADDSAEAAIAKMNAEVSERGRKPLNGSK